MLRHVATRPPVCFRVSVSGMSYWKEIIIRAWLDAWNTIFHNSFLALIAAGIINALAFGLIRWSRGADDVRKKIGDLWIFIAATILAIPVLFLFNFFFVAPAEIYAEQKEEIKSAQKRISELRGHPKWQLPAETIFTATIGSIGQSGGTTNQTVIQSDKYRPLKDRIIEALNSINPDIMPRIHAGRRVFDGSIPQIFADDLLRLTAEDSAGKFIRANTYNNAILGGGIQKTTVHVSVTDELAK